MSKLLASFAFSFVLLLLVPAYLLAAELTHIGQLETGGVKYTRWQYTGENPLLRGTAEPSAAVTVTINSVVNNVVADAAGVWSFQPTTLTEGEHQVVLASGTESYSFTLTIDSSSTGFTGTSGTGGTAPDDLPVSGTREITLVLIAGAGILILAGFKLAKTS